MEQAKQNKIFLLVIILIVLVSLFSIMIFGLFFASNPKEIPSALIGKKAFDFQVETFDGEQITLSNFKGKPVILNFWASWCVACRSEARLLQQTHLEYQSLGVVVLGIAVNDRKDKAIQFAQKYQKTYRLGLDDKYGTIALVIYLFTLKNIIYKILNICFNNMRYL